MISATAAKNPLLLSPVITNILEMLPLREIKTVRLICREWNSHAEPLLRKRAKIQFTKDFRTSDFFEFYSDSRLSALPFTAFQFTNNFDARGDSLVADLDLFFNKCGKNIKSLELFFRIYGYSDPRKPVRALNINHWIEKLSDNMDKLSIEVWPLGPLLLNSSTRLFTFNLEKLPRVKSLSLTTCHVILNSSNINRIAPSEISLMNVTFLNESENKLNTLLVTEFVDFSKCSNIQLYKELSDTAMSFDMSKDIVNAKNVEFSKIEVLNSGFSRIKTDVFTAIKTPSEAMNMQMKELNIIRENSLLNLTYLSQTIEKLQIRKSLFVRDATVPLDLPNLKYMKLAELGRRCEGISWFKNCSNLVHVHLEGGLGWIGNQMTMELDVAWLPESVKTLKMTEITEIVLLGDSHPIEVDVLLLDAFISSSEVEMLMEKIKPKILVKLVVLDKKCERPGSERAEDFIAFVRNNTQLEKIVVNTVTGLEKAGSSGRNSFLQFVEEESRWYEFNNQIGKAISKEEFEKYYNIN